MHPIRRPLPVAVLLLLAVAIPAAARQAEPSDDPALVRIYRCVGTVGTVSLQDRPCQSGHVQQLIERQRPRDPAPPAAPAAATHAPVPEAPQAPTPITRTIVVAAPEPLYECTTPEGERYTADIGDGNPRWAGSVVPVRVPVRSRVGRPPPPRASEGPAHPMPSAPPGNHRPPTAGDLWTGVATGQWIRDTCQQLGRQEACERLSGQRWEMVTRFNSALQSERQQLLTGQRRLEERMERMQCSH